MDEEAQAISATEGTLPSQFSELLREIARAPPGQSGSGWDRALLSGSVIGRFELLREIGRGGFGVVYEARDRELGRLVAFKAIHAGSTAEVREGRLLREAEAAARLSHPNIVTLYDVGRSDHGPYLVFELLKGQTLARRLEQGSMTALASLQIATGIAKGVAHAHANGVVHRDLTPRNIFLCDDDQLKVLDFGLSHAFGQRRADGGTPGFMAPEQRRGAPEDERTDVFALGVILYRLLAGELPFAGDGGAAKSAPALEVPGAPALGRLVARMLEKDPVRRPRDGAEVLTALSALLRELEQTPQALAAAPALARRAPGRRAARLVAAGLAVAVAVAAAAATIVPRSCNPPGPAISSVAVLPFDDLSPGKDQEYFSDGLADEILNALAGVEGLRVPSRTSSFFFKGKRVKLSDIGRELHVAAVLEGSVRKDGNRVRVTAQLVNVADGYRQWGATYERELTDVFEIQEEVARSVMLALGPRRADAGSPPSVGVHATKDPEAYRQYLLGRHYENQFTPQSLRLAVEAYERALAIDPGYAPAWAGLAFPLYHLAEGADSLDAILAQRRRALGAAERAVALSPHFSSALSARGLLRAVLDFDWEGGTADLQQALAANANDADSHRRYGTLLAGLGRLPEALAEGRKAVDLDPLGGVNWSTLGEVYQLQGELDLAEAAFRRDLKDWPTATYAKVGIGRNQLLQSKPRAALASFESCADEEPRLWGRAAAGHALGDAAGSRQALQDLAAKYARTSAYSIAEVYAWRGEKEAAFEWLERSYAQHDGDLAAILKRDPFLRDLRGDRRYAALLLKMKLPAD